MPANRDVIKRLYFSFGAMLAVLLALVVTAYISFSRLIEADRWNRHTYEVLLETQGIAGSLLRMQTATRGFTIAGNEEFLEPFYQGQADFLRHWEQARHLTSDREEQQERLAKLKDQQQRWLKVYIEPLLAMRRRLQDPAQAVQQANQGIVARKRRMDEILKIVAAIEATENALLKQRAERAATFQLLTKIMLIAGGAFAVLLAALLSTSLVNNTKQLLQTNEVLQKEIAERERAEEKLRVYAMQLEQNNRELQDFAYIASHDLQEPLRKIQAFGDRLKSKCSEKLDEAERDYLERMQGAAKRMQNLINDLLTFSRVTTQAQPFVPVNLATTVHEALSDLKPLLVQTGGRVETNGLPTVEADPLQIRQLLRNLIGNALKFHRPEEPPVVKVHGLNVGAAPSGRPTSANSVQILVEDNGIGFDEKYLDRIFAPFQRLHGRNEYEGTGIGLAICRKIVERHGGSITARSAPGQGTTFIVTLPAEQEGKR